ncbi:rhodanese-like domain-containing protein [Photobacterium alginatilyticum]|uniref:Rhodanese-like domain-containing protein n=1 Tax=Photobacterium alginatilyticum TaxID=1775171 RepID=A0ABW9YHV4_9GAMM|nr:rhodanese-like domain-containing protein [Photobacterium alginatilyticum]NBI53394.1 rhodanese-like domain-containing protein [Photobacterium alginatilyticum]
MRSKIRQLILFTALLASPVQAEVVTPEQFWQLHQEGNPLIVDVRTNEEFIAGHLPKSLNIPFNKIDRLATIAKDKTQPIFLYCRSGRRSGLAEEALEQLGYQYIYNGESYEALLEAMPRP